MSLIKSTQQPEISEQRGLPVEVVADSQWGKTLSAKTVQFEYYDSGTLTTDAGEAAGTVVVGKLANGGILTAVGDVMGTYYDTSFAFITGTILTTLKEFPYQTAAEYDGSTGTAKAAAITSGFANGEYCIDHRAGLIYGVKATAGTSDTANYKIAVQQAAAGGGVPSDVNITASTDGGSTPFFDADGDNTAQALKASAGNLYSLHVVNTNGTDAYVQIFNVAAGSVTVGTTTPNYVLFVPANGAVEEKWAIGMAFGTAITYACTTTATGNGDPDTGLVVSAAYK